MTPGLVSGESGEAWLGRALAAHPGRCPPTWLLSALAELISAVAKAGA
ncbi:hypothetical protein ACFV0B_20450 [Streptomyces xanthophaeus]